MAFASVFLDATAFYIHCMMGNHVVPEVAENPSRLALNSLGSCRKSKRFGVEKERDETKMNASSSSFLASLKAALNLQTEDDRYRRTNGPSPRLLHRRSRSMPLSSFPCSSSASVLGFGLTEIVAKNAAFFSGEWLLHAAGVAISAIRGCNMELQMLSMESEDKALWAIRHMDDLVRLLDLCNAMKERIAELKEYTAWVLLLSRPLANRKKRKKKKENEVPTMESWRKNCRNGKKKGDVEMEKALMDLKKLADFCMRDPPSVAMASVLRAKAVAAFSCTAMALAVSFNPGIAVNGAHLFPCFSKKNSAMASVMDAHNKLKEAAVLRLRKGSVKEPLMPELRALERALVSACSVDDKDEDDEKKKALENCVRMAGLEVESYLSMLDQKITELFRHVISQRVYLLNALSNSSHFSSVSL